LEHHLFISTITPPDLHKIVDSSKRFLQDGFKKAWDAVYLPKQEKLKAKGITGKSNPHAGRPALGSGGGAQQQMRQNNTTWMSLIGYLQKKALLPTVIFTFSKKKCEEYAGSLGNLDLLTATEKSEVHIFVEKSLARLNGSDRKLPQILRMREMLARGVGVHHGGLLPIVKEVCKLEV
jgi:antiviral helicase SKI2